MYQHIYPTDFWPKKKQKTYAADSYIDEQDIYIVLEYLYNTKQYSTTISS